MSIAYPPPVGIKCTWRSWPVFRTTDIGGAQGYLTKILPLVKNILTTFTKKKIILIVDEAEHFFRLFKNGRTTAVTSFLQKLGTRKKNSMWVFTANQVLDIFRNQDKAIERRFNHKLHIDLPKKESMTDFYKHFKGPF